MRPATRQPRAFTLVELLVVIGIIALLIAILLPTLSGARHASLVIKCLAVERAMAQAAVAHAQEHRGILPLAGGQFSDELDYVTINGLNDPGGRKYVYFGNRPAPLPAVLAPYLGVTLAQAGTTDELLAELNSDRVLQRVCCPAQDPAAITPTPTIWQGNWSNGPAVRMGYLFNGYILGAQWAPSINGDPQFPHGRLSMIRRPDQVMLFADGVPVNPFNPGYAVNTVFSPAWQDELHTTTLYDYWWLLTVHPHFGGPRIDQFDPARHRSKINVVYLDGHAETLHFPSEDITSDTLTDLHRVGISKGIYR
jgi:prepilin-type N-terminal cleavage/methylation domain-containing protein/prepilin-type processing-associated H-X9-DG protein